MKIGKPERPNYLEEQRFSGQKKLYFIQFCPVFDMKVKVGDDLLKCDDPTDLVNI